MGKLRELLDEMAEAQLTDLAREPTTEELLTHIVTVSLYGSVPRF